MTGLARLSLGTAQLGLPYGPMGQPEPSVAETHAILAQAFELGLRCLDTAPAYGCAEARLGDYLRCNGIPDGLRLVTKLPALPAGLPEGQLGSWVQQSLDDSRRSLGCEQLDTVLIHSTIDLHQRGEALRDALLQCRERGAVRAVGASLYDPRDARRLGALQGLQAAQYPFNLLDRRPGAPDYLPDLERAERHARSPLLQGLLAMDPQRLPARLAAQVGETLERLAALLRAHGLTPVGAALAFALRHCGAGHVVLGVHSQAQLQQAAEAVHTPLPRELPGELERQLGAVSEAVVDPRRWPEPPA